MHAHLHGANAPSLAAPELAHHHVVDLASLAATVASPTGLSPPENEEATGWQAGGLKGHGIEDNVSLADSVAERKEAARLTACAARHGHFVCAIGSDGFLLSKWGHCKNASSVAALKAALRRMGVPT